MPGAERNGPKSVPEVGLAVDVEGIESARHAAEEADGRAEAARRAAQEALEAAERLRRRIRRS